MKKLVIFDLDGTLCNTISDLATACNYALAKEGYQQHPLSSYPFMVGNGVRRLIERASPDAERTKIDVMLKWFREYYDEHMTDTSTPYPGITELLKELRAHDINLAVASNKYQEATSRIVAELFPDIRFVAVAGQREDIPVKPDPSIVFGILNDCPTPKRDVLYVGDSAVDIETARRACVDSVGVTWGFRPVSELRRAYADHVVSTPAEILKIALGSK